MINKIPKHKDNCSCFNCSIDINAVEARKKLDKIPQEIEDLLKDKTFKTTDYYDQVIAVRLEDVKSMIQFSYEAGQKQKADDFLKLIDKVNYDEKLGCPIFSEKTINKLKSKLTESNGGENGKE